jgi:hypothetical protein
MVSHEHRDFSFNGVVDDFAGLALPTSGVASAADFAFAAGKTVIFSERRR